jgi:hypothetical protein
MKPIKLPPGAYAVEKTAVNAGTICSFQCNAGTRSNSATTARWSRSCPVSVRSEWRNAWADRLFLTWPGRRRLALRAGLAARAANA